MHRGIGFACQFIVAIVTCLPQARAVSTAFFPQSIASGDPGYGEITVWTRLVDGDPSMDRQVTLVVSEFPTDRIGATDDLFEITKPTDGLEQLLTFNADGSTSAIDYAGYHVFHLPSLAAHEGCVKARIDLPPGDPTRGAHYYYQFIYNDGGQPRRSAIGRTWTAPAPDADSSIAFATLNGGDRVGRYYNALAELNASQRDAIQFIVHLGDYVQETNNDIAAPAGNTNRNITFPHPNDALNLGSFLAAQSLNAYRHLYKTYKSDPHLTAAHELFPWVMVWDDQEYSDDHYGATGAYTNGRIHENNPERKRAAEQAWLEFTPSNLGLNTAGTQLEISDATLYPNLDIERNLDFGKNVRLILKDYRTNRPDHLIPEDAFPGAIAVDEPTLQTAIESQTGPGSFAFVRDNFDPYFDINEPMSYFGAPPEDYDKPNPATAGFIGPTPLTFKQFIRGLISFQLLEEVFGPLPEARKSEVRSDFNVYTDNAIDGPLSATWVNLVAQAAGFPTPISQESMASMPRGISYLTMGKGNIVSDQGSRYQLVHDTFQIYAGVTFQQFTQSQGAIGRNQAFYGPTYDFDADALAQSNPASPAWRIVANSTPFTPTILNLGDVPEEASVPNTGVLTANNGFSQVVPQEIPDEFRAKTLISADGVAGFPTYRQILLDQWSQISQGSTVILSGDINAGMLGTNFTSDGRTVVDITAPPMSSPALRRAFLPTLTRIESLILPGYQQAFPNLPNLKFQFLGKQEFLNSIDTLLSHNTPELQYLNTGAHGYVVIEADADTIRSQFHELAAQNVFMDKTAENISALMTIRPFTIQRSNGDLSVTQEPVVHAPASRNSVTLEADQVSLSNIPTEEGTLYTIVYAQELNAENWTPIPANAIHAVDQSVADPSGRLIGTGGPVSVLFSIPEALRNSPNGFFSVEEVSAEPLR